MNARVRSTLETMKTPLVHEKVCSLVMSFRTNFKMGPFVSPENEALVFQFPEILRKRKLALEASLIGIPNSLENLVFISPFCYIVFFVFFFF